MATQISELYPLVVVEPGLLCVGQTWAYWMYRYDDFSAHARNFEQLTNKIAWRVALPPKPVALGLSLSGSKPKSESP